MSGLAEKSLLIAVREKLRLPTDQGGAGYAETECDVEPDQDVPATSGQVYVAVMPGGWQPGERHAKSGGVRDMVYSLSVMVARRIGNVPRDRRTDVFMNNLASIDADVERIIKALDWQQSVVNAASGILQQLSGSSQPFIHPLVAGQVGPPALVGAEVFSAAAGVQPAGMKRVIPFGNARLIQTL
ncbi:MAG: hypothetical protein L0228_10040 [Planctomycetes bacterium]|nr:hypothetical protein [Planctomycetota bacterium]